MNHKFDYGVHYNVIKNAKISGNVRKTECLFDRSSKGFLYGIKKEDAQAFANQVDSMITVLNETHGENWDFHIEPVTAKTFDFYLVIKYPELHITNSENRSYDLKDLYVLTEIVESEFRNENDEPIYKFKDPRGFKSKFTYEEWFTGYNHSHLGTYKPNKFTDCFYIKSFCLGDGTEIHSVMESLYTEYSPELFQLFLCFYLFQ